MATPISSINSIALPDLPRAERASAGGAAFQEALSNAIQSVEAFGRNASSSVERFLSGEGEELHTTVLATQRAELSFELFLQVRNKAINAYQEIMRMPM